MINLSSATEQKELMTYPGRKLPYRITSGKPLEPAPLYVSHLMEDRVVLFDGISAKAKVSSKEIAFQNRGQAWENEDLYRKLAELNSNGIPFEIRPGEMISPHALMLWWQDTGKLADNFREIAWRDAGEWHIATIEPPVVGVLGWRGPAPYGH